MLLHLILQPQHTLSLCAGAESVKSRTWAALEVVVEDALSAAALQQRLVLGPAHTSASLHAAAVHSPPLRSARKAHQPLLPPAARRGDSEISVAQAVIVAMRQWDCSEQAAESMLLQVWERIPQFTELLASHLQFFLMVSCTACDDACNICFSE